MLIILPVGMNYRTERYPVVTLTLIGINTLVYLVSLFFFFDTRGESDFWIMQHFWLIPANSVLCTYLTSMFVHAGFFHLLGNMIFLFLFGCCVEDIIGRTRFVIYYLVGGLIAELAYIALSPEHFASKIPMGGASGAISACMGMYLLLRAGADIDFKYWYFFLIFGGAGSGDFSVPAWMAISFWFLKDLFWAVMALVFQQKGGGVAFGAHVGGLLGGLALAGVYRMVERKPEVAAPHDLILDPLPAMATAAMERANSTSETPTIFLHDGAEQTGPFTLSQVQARLLHGTISKETLYWSEGMADWESVVELAGHPIG